MTVWSLYSFRISIIHSSIYPSVHSPIHVPIYPSIYSSVCLSIHPSIYPSIHLFIKMPYSARFGSTYTKIGTIQRRLAWPLRKDDTQIREAFHIFQHRLKGNENTMEYLSTSLAHKNLEDQTSQNRLSFQRLLNRGFPQFLNRKNQSAF